MPLKHHTETAYMLLLGLVLAVSGFLMSMLPHLPGSLLYWMLLFGASVLYPLLLLPTFKRNRADYEFRFLHWLPAIMFLLWAILDVLSRKYIFATILFLGFTYLWSLPFVILGLLLTIMFALHVIRRWMVRVGVLSAMLLLFILGSITAEAHGWNTAMSAYLFPASRMSRIVAARYANLQARILGTQSGEIIADSTTIGSVVVYTQPDYNLSTHDNGAYLAQIRQQEDMKQLNKKYQRLPRSGPEDVGMLLLGCVALCCGTLHIRAKARI